ncbi:DJ-1/PfpI family protein [Rothia endophytica]|uniref:DJ-1/PfpI family protein n=1 Tax=Rothia endophytica TaxID=1324766 RepID=UPI001F2629A4|nr:DJ-1/PfpI family protein [Rothia endophytica]
MSGKKTIAVILFDDFELLDVFGPVELLQFVSRYHLEFYAPTPGKVRSSQGIEVIAPHSLADLEGADLLLVPGGKGTRALVNDQEFIKRLTLLGHASSTVASVCTGAALLARAGLLSGHKATTNKRDYHWVTSFGPDVLWQSSARWVQDRTRWTSSGISAGIDMTAALIGHFEGQEVLQEILNRAELTVATDPSHDPFAITPQR